MSGECKRCGKCCYLKDPYSKGYWFPCKQLKWLDKDKTKCKIYEHRLGMILEYGWKCKENSPWNIPGCPFNHTGKHPHPFWSKQGVLK